MALLPQQHTLDAVRWPTSTSRDLLAFIHSGDVLRKTLPRILRIGVVLWLSLYTLLWIAAWAGIYEQFERWGLVKAFFAHLIVLGAAFLIARITFLRAEHLASLPPDDFVVVRATAVLSRWLGEVVLLYLLGGGLSTLLQPVGAALNGLIGSLSPSMASAVSAGTPSLLFASAPLALLWTLAAAVLFLLLYTVANMIDLALAIEFNTRAERVGKRTS